MRKLVVAVMVLMLGLAACGSDDSSSNDSSKDTDTTAATTDNSTAAAPVTLSGKVNDKGTKDATGKSELEVEADDYYFEPTFIKATAGQKISLELKNEGTATHTFTSTELGVDKELKPDETATIDITVPSSDAVVFFCRFHQSGGMQGAVYTKEGAMAGDSGSTATTAASSNGY